MSDPHLGSDQLAAWAEHRLGGSDRAAVEQHIADCAACRQEASAIALQISGEIRRYRRRRLAAPLLATAAVLAFVVISKPFAPAPDSVGLRPAGDPEQNDLRRLPSIAPAEGATIPLTPLTFVWHADGPDATYRFTLADEAGGQLWATTVADTTLELPDSIALRPGSRYRWYVDVQLLTGERATTGVRTFTTTR